MAQVTSNILTPAQQALNSKLFSAPTGMASPFSFAPSNGANPFAKPPATPANTGYGTNGAPMSVLPPGSIKAPAPATPAPVTTPAPVAPASSVIAPQTPAVATNPNYVPGSIGPGNTPLLPNVAPGAPGSSTNGGAVAPVNSQPNLPVTPQTPALQQAPNTAPGILNTVLGTASGNIPLGQNAADIANQYGTQIAQVGNLGAGAQAGDLSTGTNVVGEGNAAIASQSASARMSALSAAEQAALQGNAQQLTAQQQALGGQESALGTASNLTASPYGTPLVNPATGQTITGGQSGTGTTGTGSTLNPLNNLSSIAQQVISGQLSLSDAQNLGGSISNWNGTLNQAILAQNPNFNFNQAQVNSTIQGSIGPQSALASQVLQNLQNTLSSVPAWQSTGNQTINSLGQLLDNSGIAGAGSQQSSQALTDSVNEARTSVSTALGTAYNTTPTAFTGMVDAWFPDNPTPAQVQAGVNEFNALMSARSSSFSSPGNVPLPSNSNAQSNTTSDIYNF